MNSTLQRQITKWKDLGDGNSIYWKGFHSFPLLFIRMSPQKSNLTHYLWHFSYLNLSPIFVLQVTTNSQTITIEWT